MFIDPKGTRNTSYKFKVDGFKEIFSKNQKHNGLDVKVMLFLYTDDQNTLPLSLQPDWRDSIEKCLAECT